jgi:hypothetical protein
VLGLAVRAAFSEVVTATTVGRGRRHARAQPTGARSAAVGAGVRGSGPTVIGPAVWAVPAALADVVAVSRQPFVVRPGVPA